MDMSPHDDVGVASTAHPATGGVTSNNIKTPRRRYKAQVLHCLADGCRTEIGQSSSYSMRYRLCHCHIRSPSVLHRGEEKRFCQQCSRLHEIEAFDGKRRSCRDRLKLHKERQRAKLGQRGSGDAPEEGDQLNSVATTDVYPEQCIAQPPLGSSSTITPSRSDGKTVSFMEAPEIHTYDGPSRAQSSPAESAYFRPEVPAGLRRIVVQIRRSQDGSDKTVDDFLTMTQVPPKKLAPKPRRRVAPSRSEGHIDQTPPSMDRSRTWGAGREELRLLSSDDVDACASSPGTPIFRDYNPRIQSCLGQASADHSLEALNADDDRIFKSPRLQDVCNQDNFLISSAAGGSSGQSSSTSSPGAFHVIPLPAAARSMPASGLQRATTWHAMQDGQYQM